MNSALRKARDFFGGHLNRNQRLGAWLIALGVGYGWYRWDRQRRADSVVRYDGQQGAFTEKEQNAWNRKIAADNPGSFQSEQAKEAHVRAEEIRREKRERQYEPVQEEDRT
eukprot:gb/GECG01016227.1/.p1 GENE.gb/GECG01016227.1/~~gb/GECG01016227.1/.p1  ORF type:complete len:111 (+),score=14.63 gb/GECG01016227.1/:1-333(+)